MKAQALKTKPNKTLVIFCSLVVLFSIGITLLFVFIDEPLVLKIFVYVICSIFFALSIFMILVQLFDYVCIDGGKLIHHRLTGKQKININEITKVIYNKNAYEIYVDDKFFCFLNPTDSGGKQILLYLEKNHVSITSM